MARSVAEMNAQIERLKEQLESARAMRRTADQKVSEKRQLLLNERARTQRAIEANRNLRIKMKKQTQRQLADRNTVNMAKRLTKAADERCEVMRSKIQERIQETLQTAKLPNCVKQYISAAKEEEAIGWVSVSHRWVITTQLAGVSTMDRRFAIYALESKYLTDDSIEMIVKADHWIPCDSPEYGSMKRGELKLELLEDIDEEEEPMELVSL